MFLCLVAQLSSTPTSAQTPTSPIALHCRAPDKSMGQSRWRRTCSSLYASTNTRCKLFLNQETRCRSGLAMRGILVYVEEIVASIMLLEALRLFSDYGRHTLWNVIGMDRINLRLAGSNKRFWDIFSVKPMYIVKSEKSIKMSQYHCDTWCTRKCPTRYNPHFGGGLNTVVGTWLHWTSCP